MKKAIAVFLSIIFILAVTLPASAVSTIDVKSIKLSDSKLVITVGETENIAVSFTPDNTTQKKLTFNSSNKNVATVNANGDITGVRAGSATITVTTPNKAVTEKCSVTVKALNPVNLTWVYGGWSIPRDLSDVVAAANKYLINKINTTINIKVLDWGTYAQRRDLMIAANEKVDICFSGSWCGYFENLPKGVYLNISDLLTKYAPKTKALVSPLLWEGAKFRGGIYGIPANKEAAQDWGFMYRKDITDKDGINMNSVKTVADFEKILYKVKEKEPNITPIQNADLEPFYTFDKYEAFDGVNQAVAVKVDNGKFKAISFFELPEVMQAWKQTHKWYVDGLVNKDVLTLQDFSAQENAGTVFSYHLNLKPYKDAESNVSAVKPIVWKQIDITKAVGNQNAVAGSMMNIPKTCKNPERAIMFLELFNTDKYLNNLINFGIENKHYVKVGTNRIDYPKGVTADTSGYNPQSQWVYGNQFINYLWPSEKDDKWQKYQEYNDKAVKSPIVSFVFDSAPVKTEIAAMTNINNQYRNSLRYGAVDPTVVGPQFVAKLKDAGLEKVIAEAQKQLDAWAAANK